jgi:hypothetical protein
MMVANYPMYLCSLKEDNIMKKMLLDICYREHTKQSDIHLYDLHKDDPLIKKIAENLKGSKYPSDGPLLN